MCTDLICFFDLVFQVLPSAIDNAYRDGIHMDRARYHRPQMSIMVRNLYIWHNGSFRSEITHTVTSVHMEREGS